jgi:hypothetical protein
MKPPLKTWIAVLTMWAGLHAVALSAAEAPRMGKDELKPRLGSPELVVIDVRAYTDWVLSGEKIRSAVREDYRDFETWSAKFPRDKTLVLYCA